MEWIAISALMIVSLSIGIKIGNSNKKDKPLGLGIVTSNKKDKNNG